MYRVIETFADAQDYFHVYNVGDEYPREGLLVSDARLEELASNKNRLRIPVIELVIAKKESKPKKEDESPKKKSESKSK